MVSKWAQPPTKRLFVMAGVKGAPLGPAAPVWDEEEDKCWRKGSSRVRQEPACLKSAVESAKHRNCMKTSFIQSHCLPVSCFILEGDSRSVSPCVLVSHSAC